MIDKIGQYISDKFLSFPLDASLFGYKTDVLNGWVHLLMLILFVFWGIFLIYILIVFASRNNPKASYAGMKGKFSKYTEGAIVGFEIFLLFALAIPGYYDLKFEKLESNDSEVEIRVIAQQFQWNIHYPGEDGVFGQTYADSVDDGSQNFIGLSRQGYGEDDIVTMNQLHIPKNKLVKRDNIFAPYLQFSRKYCYKNIFIDKAKSRQEEKEMFADLFVSFLFLHLF